MRDGRGAARGAHGRCGHVQAERLVLDEIRVLRPVQDAGLGCGKVTPEAVAASVLLRCLVALSEAHHAGLRRRLALADGRARVDGLELRRAFRVGAHVLEGHVQQTAVAEILALVRGQRALLDAPREELRVGRLARARLLAAALRLSQVLGADARNNVLDGRAERHDEAYRLADVYEDVAEALHRDCLVWNTSGYIW